MSDAPITQDALDRLESNLRTAIREQYESMKQLMAANDQRYEQRFGDATTAVNAALQAAEKAVSKAETASDKRFESVNEFRSTLADQQRTFIPRSEADLRMSTLEASITLLTKTGIETSGHRTGSLATWSWIVSIVGFVSLLLGIITFVTLRFPK